MSAKRQGTISNAKILPPRKAGRPRLEEVSALTNHIVLVARDVFFEMGLGAATIDLVALRARISKETLYTRFKDKQILFEAVLQALVDDWAVGTASNPAINTKTLEEALLQITMTQIRAMLSPDFQGMIRLINAESHAYPDITRRLLEKVDADRIPMITKQIRKFEKIDKIPCRDPDTAAEILRGMITGWVGTLVILEPDFNATKQKEVALRIVEVFMASRAAW